MDHRDIDLRSLEMHQVVADKIVANPALLQEAEIILCRWMSDKEHGSMSYFLEWQKAISAGPEICIKKMTELLEKADALRQSSPFPCLLPNVERLAILEKWRRPNAPSPA